MTREIEVLYEVIVGCVVDLDAGDVLTVEAYVGNSAPTGECVDADRKLLDPEADAGKIAQAIRIAESAAWPQWESNL